MLRGTRSTAGGGEAGHGIAIQGDVTASFERVLVESSHEGGVSAIGPITASFVDLTVLEVRGRDLDGAFGRGVSLFGGASIDIRRATVTDVVDTGLMVAGSGSVLRLEDVAVSQVGLGADGVRGRALIAQQGARLEVVRVRTQDTSEYGLFADGAGTTLVVEDLAIRDVESNAEGRRGLGIGLQNGASAQMDRVVVERGRSYGIIALAGASLIATHLTVLDTRERGCAVAACADAPAGINVGSVDDSMVDISDFAFIGSALCGVQVAGTAGLDLVRGEIAESAIGACVQVDGYEIARLRTDVIYRDNGVNLEATALALPDPSLPVDLEEAR